LWFPRPDLAVIPLTNFGTSKHFSLTTLSPRYSSTSIHILSFKKWVALTIALFESRDELERRRPGIPSGWDLQVDSLLLPLRDLRNACAHSAHVPFRHDEVGGYQPGIHWDLLCSRLEPLWQYLEGTFCYWAEFLPGAVEGDILNWPVDQEEI
jgi:hypothetical protein